MNKDQKLLEEAYQSIYESAKEPLYFGPSKQKDLWLKWLEEHDHKVNEDGSIDMNGPVELKKVLGTYYSLFPMRVLPFKFRNINNGGFDIRSNNLRSTRNFPEFVDGDFNASTNYIKSLKGCPKIINGDALFNWCCDLKSLKGGPEIVKGDFECFYTEVDSLEGAPEEIGGKFKSNKLDDDDYRAYAKQLKRQKVIDRDLHKDFNIDLEDFS